VSDFRSTFRKVFLTAAVPLPLMLGLWPSTCSESLPPYSEPQHPIEAAVVMASGEIDVVMGISHKTGHDTVVTMTYPSIIATFKNVYDEVLQDSVYVRGTIEIWDVDRPGNLATIDLLNAYTTPAPSGKGHMVTLLPNAYATTGSFWNNYTTGALPRPFWIGVPSRTIAETIPGSNGSTTYLVTDVIHLAVRATVQLFASYGKVTSPIAKADVYYKIQIPRQN